MVLNQKRFNQFIDTIENINPNTLSTRLREMEQSKIIEKKIFNETPIRIEYHLTKKGKALKPILEEMAEFSTRFCCGDIFKDNKPRSFRHVFGKNLNVVN